MKRLLYYNFPPFSVGEVRRLVGTSRREIGHGNLAERAVNAVMPPPEEFPYSARVVSEILESNGSSSMASVCGASLALFDAGCPLRSPVAGIAMGLIKEGEQFFVLSDILGSEDHNGDMDFKVAGTKDGVTAPSSLTSMRTLNCACRPLMVLPPGPMRKPIFSTGICLSTSTGAHLLTPGLAASMASAMRPRMCRRPSRACSSARPSSAPDRPLTLMSICSAVTPSL